MSAALYGAASYQIRRVLQAMRSHMFVEQPPLSNKYSTNAKKGAWVSKYDVPKNSGSLSSINTCTEALENAVSYHNTSIPRAYIAGPSNDYKILSTSFKVELVDNSLKKFSPRLYDGATVVENEGAAVYDQSSCSLNYCVILRKITDRMLGEPYKPGNERDSPATLA